MSYIRNHKTTAAGVCLLLMATIGIVWAADTDVRFYDKAQVHVHTGTTDADVSAATLTSATTLLTIAPAAGSAMRDVYVTFDLDKTTTGFNDTHSDGSVTISFLKGIKVDGTNYRPDAQTATSTVSGPAANTRSVTMDVGTITPDQGCIIYVVLSAEDEDFELPYTVTYRATKKATFTDVAN